MRARLVTALVWLAGHYSATSEVKRAGSNKEAEEEFSSRLESEGYRVDGVVASELVLDWYRDGPTTKKEST